jgi:CO/xanthine dehydrogenase FAD-binding subunit
MASYLRPTELHDALAALSRPGPARTILAGGTDHYPARVIGARDEDILDITALPGLRTIERRVDHWFIPCLATWSDVRAAALPPAFDGLRAAAAQIGGVQVQNAGTVCGNLCNASPAADGTPNLMALDAAIELASLRGTRTLPVRDFVRDSRRTALAEDEMAIGLRIPAPSAPARGVFLKLGARRYLVISIVMVAAVAEFAADGRIMAARVAVGACAPVARHLPALEAALLGQYPDPALVRAEHIAPLAPIRDVRGTAAYRRDAALELLRRAVAALGDEARRAA